MCYLIREGVCELVSKASPLRHVGAHKNSVFVPLKRQKEKISVGQNDGYFSKTMAHFNFADVSGGEWVGEDLIFSDYQSVNYSVVAKSDIVALEF